MKIIVEYEIEPSGDNKDADLDPEQVTLRLKRRLQNADIINLRLDYMPEPDKSEKRIWFLATLNQYTAVESA